MHTRMSQAPLPSQRSTHQRQVVYPNAFPSLDCRGLKNFHVLGPPQPALGSYVMTCGNSRCSEVPAESSRERVHDKGVRPEALSTLNGGSIDASRSWGGIYQLGSGGDRE